MLNINVVALRHVNVKIIRDIAGHGATAQLTDGYAHKIKEHKKQLMEHFASGFCGESIPAGTDD